MKDIPLFTTDAGVASLVLGEIPYRKEAFVRIRDVLPGRIKDIVAECVPFCRMAGAERVYAADHEALKDYPLYTSVIEMRGEARPDPEKIENLFPVTDTTVERWRQICNQRLQGVDCAATMTAADEKRIVSSGGAYFVHRKGELLGTGWVEDGKLLVICSVKPGFGERVLHTLMSLVEDGRMILEVASTNERAIRLYERLGFVKIRELHRWYKIF